MSKGKKKEPTLRQRKVNSFVQKRLAEIFRDEEIPGLTGFITITKVDVSPDLRDGKVFLSIFNQPAEEALKALSKKIFFIQGKLFEGATMKFIPKVRFAIDPSAEYSQHINEVLRNINEQDDEK